MYDAIELSDCCQLAEDEVVKAYKAEGGPVSAGILALILPIILNLLAGCLKPKKAPIKDVMRVLRRVGPFERREIALAIDERLPDLDFKARQKLVASFAKVAPKATQEQVEKLRYVAAKGL